MVIYLVVLGAVCGMFRKHGWLSPLFGAIATGVTVLLGSLYASTFVFMMAFFGHSAKILTEDGSLPLWLSAICGLAAGGSAILIFQLVLRTLPPINPRRVSKTTTVPYRLLGTCLLLLTVIIPLCIGIRKDPRSVVLLILLSLMGAMSSFRLARQKRADRSRRALFQENRAPILFLRSFELCKAQPASDSLRTDVLVALKLKVLVSFDEKLAKAVRDLGPLIALGDPDDYLPSPGAYKLYQTDEKWKEYLSQVIGVSRAVLLVEGTTTGLQWELGHIRRCCDPSRVLVLTLTRELRKIAQKRAKEPIWPKFDGLLREAGFLPMPSDPGHGAIVAFAPDWTPRILAQKLKKERAYSEVLSRQITEAPNLDHAMFSRLLDESINSADDDYFREVKRKTGLAWLAGVLGTLFAALLAFFVSFVVCLGLSAGTSWFRTGATSGARGAGETLVPPADVEASLARALQEDADREIRLTVPPGYVDMKSEHKDVFDAVDQRQRPNRLLAYYVPQGEVGKAVFGSYILVTSNWALAGVRVSPVQFQSMKGEMAKGFQDSISKMPDVETSGLAKQSVVVRSNSIRTHGVVLDTENQLGLLMSMRVEVKADDGDLAYMDLCLQDFLCVHNRLLAVATHKVYRSEADVNGVITQGKEYASHVIADNAVPLTKPRSKGDF